MRFRTAMSLCLALLAFTLPPAPARAADTYFVDTTHASVLFGVSHLNLSYTYGFFRKFEGAYILDRNNPAACRFRFSIQTDSIDTNSQQRDEHLKSPDFFNVRQFPNITFDSTSCELAKSAQGKPVYNVTGNLTMLGQTRPVTIPLEMLGEGKGPQGETRSGFFSQFELKRSDFGMTKMVGPIGDAVRVTLSFEGILQQEQRPGGTQGQ